MKRLYSIAVAVAMVLAFGIADASAQVAVKGDVNVGGRLTDQDNTSVRFNEYRDIQKGLFLRDFVLDVRETKTGKYLVVSGRNIARDDQSVRLRGGDFRNDWKATFTYSGVPHRFADAAMTPYMYQGDGLYTVTAPAAIVKDADPANGTPSLVPTVPQMAVNDDILGAYVAGAVAPVGLGIQRDKAELELDYAATKSLGFRVALSSENREGDRLTYGPIGDRPPRTLNTQLPEPVDFTTREVEAGVDYVGSRFQANLKYSLSAFSNNLASMRWQNMFFAPDAGLDYVGAMAGTARNVSQFGQKALAPDNIAQQFVFTGSLRLPMKSRLTGTAALGFMNQDETLLPYSVSTLGTDRTASIGDGLAWNDTAKLPRQTAEAEMQTLRARLEYSISPMKGLNVRAYGGYEALDNKTPTVDWRYVTQDAAGTDGSVNFRNFRTNLAYAYDRMRFGVDVRHNLPVWRTAVGLGLRRQSVGREFREADTDENQLEVTLRTSPVKWLTLKAGFLGADRQADGYDYNVTAQSYWYTLAQGDADPDNPAYMFANHPDLRKYDVSDRARTRFDVGATVITDMNLDFTVGYLYRKDDFESDVVPVAPLENTTVTLPTPSDRNAMTPGQQLGLLEDSAEEISLDLNYVPGERISLHGFASFETGSFLHSGMVFNENARRQPSAPSTQAPTALGPWTDANRIYTADIHHTTNTFGAGVGFEAIPGRLRFQADFVKSSTTEDMAYEGYGSDLAYLGIAAWENFEFGFDDPATVEIDYTVITLGVEYEINDRLQAGLEFLRDEFSIVDWQQDLTAPMYEEVGSSYFIRDITRDNRWGNRLVNMGGNLAPGYVFNGVGMTLSYTF